MMNEMSPYAVLEMEGVSALPFGSLLVLIGQQGPDVPWPVLTRVYQLWINAQGPQHPRTANAWYNLGVTFAQQRMTEQAIACYEAAITLRPGFYEAAQNLGLMLEGAGKREEALALWQANLQPIHAQTALLNHTGRLNETMGRLTEAVGFLKRSLLLEPLQPDVIQHWVHLRQRLCLWPVLEEGLPGLSLDYLNRHAGPLGTLALTDDISIQHEVAAGWIERKTTAVEQRLSPVAGYSHHKLRVGYMSSDFCRHAMSYLIADLFEHHDTERFEIYGYDSSRDDGSEIRKRILSSFHKVTRIAEMKDAEAAQCIRDDEIDVLIDLNGLTLGARMQVLRYKPAPIQATYLGFIGPVPLPELDYLLCDDFVIPAEAAGLYEPKPWNVGPLYQANDSQREIDPPTTRAEVGIPEEGFLFCCFSNYYKITPEIFAGWMAILHGVPNSMLWLADDGSVTHLALKAHAQAAGIDPNRLLFTARVGPAAYLARLQLADMFLDTFPYNAGTVASDAIRMRVPLITQAGRSFASRMAARLLHSIGAGAGVAETIEDYVAFAIKIATDPAARAEYAQCFTPERWHAGPGNIKAFTAAFEQSLLAMKPAK